MIANPTRESAFAVKTISVLLIPASCVGFTRYYARPFLHSLGQTCRCVLKRFRWNLVSLRYSLKPQDATEKQLKGGANALRVSLPHREPGSSGPPDPES